MTNLALSKTVTTNVAEIDSSHLVANAVDGDTSTGYLINQGTTPPSGQGLWFTCDLGANAVLTDVTLVPFTAQGFPGLPAVQSLTITGSLDGTNFNTPIGTTPSSVTSGTTQVVVTPSSPVTVRYVRVTFPGTVGQYGGFAEFQANGTLAGTTPTTYSVSPGQPYGLTGAPGTASSLFTVAIPNGTALTSSVVITPSDGGNGGSFSPATITLNASTSSATFTYTPSSTGSKTLSFTNNGSLTNPSNLTFTVSATINLAIGKTVTTSTAEVNSTYLVANAVDNDTTTGYLISQGNAPPLEFVVDLGAVFTIANIEIVPYTNGGFAGNPATQSISLTAGTTLTATGTPLPTTIGTTPATVTAPFIVTPSSPVTARYVKATFPETAGQYGGFAEFRVNGSTGGSVATTYTLTGPTSGTVSVQSANFTVALPSGTYLPSSVTITPSDGGAGGSFSPTTVSIGNGVSSTTFKYTPASTGAKTISVTNGSTLTNPASLTYNSTAPGVALAAAPTLSVSTSNTVTLTANASGGTSPYTYQWHRYDTLGATIGSGTAIAGATTAVYQDTSPYLLKPTYYKVVVTDSAGTPAALTSDPVGTYIVPRSLKIGFLGDSLTANAGGSTDKTGFGNMKPFMDALMETGLFSDITCVNRGIPGSTSANWQPDGTGNGSYAAAKSAFQSAGCHFVFIQLGTNDSLTGSQYTTAIANIASDLVSAGFKVILNRPTPVALKLDKAFLQTISQYLAPIVDNINIFYGDFRCYHYFLNRFGLYYDNLHPDHDAVIVIEKFWAQALLHVIGAVEPQVKSRSRRVSTGR